MANYIITNIDVPLTLHNSFLVLLVWHLERLTLFSLGNW